MKHGVVVDVSDTGRVFARQILLMFFDQASLLKSVVGDLVCRLQNAL